MTDTNEHFITKYYQIIPLCSSCFQTTFVQWDVTNIH